MKQKTKFKQTEIGKIPEDWAVTTVEEIAAKSKNAISMGPFGSNITKDNFVSSGVPVIRGNNMKEFRFHDDDFVFLSPEKAQSLKASIVRKNDIIITHRGTLGQVGIIHNECRYDNYIVSQSGMKLTCDLSKVNYEYIFYYLKSPVGQQELLKNTSQTGVPAISRPTTSLKNIKIPLPSLEEQFYIAKILSDLDSKIELNRQMNKTLESIGQVIFKHWFIDFEFPNEEGKPYKSSGGEMFYNEDFGKEIPKGWVVKLLSDAAEIVDCLHTKKSDEEASNNVLLQVYNIGEYGTLDLTQKYTVSDSDYKEWTKNIEVREGDILFTNAGKVGAIGRVPFYFIGGIGRNITSVRPNISSVYLLRYLLSSYGRFEIYKNTDIGTIFNSLNVKGVRKLKILIPNSDTMIKFNQTYEHLRKKVEINILQNINLSQIRDVLIPKFMSGKIRVPL